MSLLPPEIRQLVESEKQIPTRPAWDEKSDPRHYVFTVSLRVSGITIGGFELRAKVSKHFIDRAGMMQLEYARSGRDRIELWRGQWRPFETHTNKAWGPPGFELARFESRSHHHPFMENYIPEKNVMRDGSLPAALPIDPDPGTLSDFIAFCGRSFRISNIEIIEVPARNADFFWIPND